MGPPDGIPGNLPLILPAAGAFERRSHSPHRGRMSFWDAIDRGRLPGMPECHAPLLGGPAGSALFAGREIVNPFLK